MAPLRIKESWLEKKKDELGSCSWYYCQNSDVVYGGVVNFKCSICETAGFPRNNKDQHKDSPQITIAARKYPFNPAWFRELKKLSKIRNLPIWDMVIVSGSCGFREHPVLSLCAFIEWRNVLDNDSGLSYNYTW